MSTREIELTIDSIGAGGDGIGRSDGMVVFVPRSAPGDRARVRINSKKRFARGEIESIIDPSRNRVDAPCPHYVADRCGGCQLQHMSYESQLTAKRTIIHDGLTRIGKRAVDVPPVRPSDPQWRYRTKLTLAMRRRSGAERWVIGLHAYDAPDTVFHLDDCLITDPRVIAVWREISAASDLLPRSETLRGSVRLVAEPNVTTALIEGGDQWPNQHEFFRAVPSLTALWWKGENGPRIHIADRGATIGGHSFGQVNVVVAEQLQRYVVERVATYAPKTVIDAYAGIGNTAASLAAVGIWVTAIEADRDAGTQCAWRLAHGSRTLIARVEDVIEKSLPVDVVIVNPPRTGLDARVTTILENAARAPRAIFYVSCDPATLGRDLARMPRYRVASVLGFDMFPQTAHVETVCELVPGGATA